LQLNLRSSSGTNGGFSMNDQTETVLAIAARPYQIESDRAAKVDVHPLHRPSVLIVDDDPASLLAIGAILGDLNQRLSFAQSGAEALRLLLDNDFAVVVLDVRMPGMSGYEIARYIRARERTAHTPIIFLTGMGAEEGDVFEGYYAGAVDFLTKPVTPHILRAKVKTFVHLFLASEEIKRQAELLRESERREHQRQLAEQLAHFDAEQLRHEMQLAARIQRRLFPQLPPRSPGFDIFGESHTAEVTGGDYFDYFPLADHNLGIAIGDVCGHGVASALTMATTRAYVRALFLGTPRPSEVLRLANQALADDIADGHFVTLLLAELDPREHTLRYAGAGHPPGHVVSASGEVKAVLSSQGPALGILDKFDFSESEQPLAAGDVVFFLTDGIIEAADAQTRLFGMDRALEVVRANLHQPASTICRELRNAARRFANRSVLDDDATSIVIKVQA
jgi:serine phosphatase RsbU (regulator of sigma subunit)